jgi:L-alanine-DL-glutamate epimerase-like enolase superfamily enzyme
MYMSPEAYAEEAAAVESLGYAGYKMRPGIGPDEDLRAVELMRDACGRLELMVDAHTWWRMGDRNYDLATVERLAEGMAEFDVTWLEEPLPPSDHQAYADLRSRVSVPLAGGEHESALEGLIELTASGCVDFVQADPVCQGGFSTIRRLLGEVERRESHFAFHCWGTDFEVLAAAHLGICWEPPVVPWLEQAVYRRDGVPVMYPFPLAHQILRDPLPMRDGDLVVPREAGWGVPINEAVLGRFPWIPGPWSRFRLISPPGEWAVTGDHSVQWALPQQS